MSPPSQAVILGAGYGGLAAARRLGRRLAGAEAPRVEVRLVDRHPYHLLETRLHEAVARGTDVTVGIERALEGLPVTFVQGSVARVDLRGKAVEVAGAGTLRYDALVVALGSRTHFYGIPGLAEHALELKDLDDVERIRARLDAAAREAAGEPNPQRRRERLTVVIGGGGLTGVELAAELGETLPGLLARHDLDPRDLDLIVVEMGPRILPSLDPPLGRRAADHLASLGVRVLTGTRIVEARAGGVVLEPGGSLAAGVVVWTGGVRAAEFFGQDGAIETGRQGRLVVDERLAIPGQPGVFAVGDVALAKDPETGEPVPPAAQFALQQGEVAADNVLAFLTGAPPRRYEPRRLAELVSLGRYAAVGWAALPWAGRLRLVGYLGALLKWASQARYEATLGSGGRARGTRP